MSWAFHTILTILVHVSELVFSFHTIHVTNRVSYRILSWGGGRGEGEKDGSRMTVAHESTLTYMRVPTRGIWKHAPQENFEFRSSPDASWDKIVV